MQINELEGQFHQKAKEIGMIQTELKTMKEFQKRKIVVEKELDEVSFFLFLIFKERFILCVFMFCLHVYKYTSCIPGAGGDQKRKDAGFS